jgi:hypothetical protein
MGSIERTIDATLAPDEERRLAADLFNHTWELLETPDRTPAQDDRMIHAPRAARFHREQVGDAGTSRSASGSAPACTPSSATPRRRRMFGVR